jgi:hypothetical protein
MELSNKVKKSVMAGMAVTMAATMLVGCGGGVTVGGFSSKYIDSDDYDEAVQQFMTEFESMAGFEGCTLKKVGYAGDQAVKAEADAQGLAPERVIVLTTTFETDGEDHGNGLEPNHTYDDYTCVMTRLSSADIFWEIAEFGNG